MKKTNAYILGLATLAGVLALGATTVSAYQGDYTKQGPNYTPERHEAMEKALGSVDYKAWSELMNGRGRVTQVINETNFARFAEAHKLAESGDLEGADQIRKELGLRTRGGERVGAGYKGGNGESRGMNKGSCVTQTQ